MWNSNYGNFPVDDCEEAYCLMGNLCKWEDYLQYKDEKIKEKMIHWCEQNNFEHFYEDQSVSAEEYFELLDQKMNDKDYCKYLESKMNDSYFTKGHLSLLRYHTYDKSGERTIRIRLFSDHDVS